ncbi:ABC transporter related [Candidatus Promineifilum breve]|uniref:ABC transporter related n=1 Tax=Candidatus Promineifilum breve TaxID=1806508 RepID=A0A160T111_9CHLR|nr:ABC-F family ATP-binding cassette domain-containing protein [Candidatus Promineifilum breve]CUS02135.2 ABC transporter related [Candidatus Promineifilum breve]
MAEIIVKLDRVTVTLAGRPIFSDLTWEIQRGQRIGLVGPNGAGKSTIMKLVAQELTVDAGQVFRLSGLTWGRLEQEPHLPGGRTVLQEALTALPELAAIEQALDALADRMAQPDVYGNPKTLEKALRAQERLLHQFEQLEGPRYESKVKETLLALGFGPAEWGAAAEHLSGGQKKLVMLAKLLVQQPALLLLDEPDNHLDLPAKRALENTIRTYPGCVVIISHDRYLLDEVATHIAELESGRLTQYLGNYTAYANERALRRLRQQQLYAAQQKEIARIEAAIARFELWASLVVNERHIRQARSRQKMLDKMDKIEKVNEAKRMTLELNGWRGSNKVVELVNVGRTFDNGRVLFRQLNLTIWHGERVGLVGPNGAGKSELFKMLLDPENISQGEVKIGPSIQIGYYAQEQETLDPDQDLITCIRQAAPLTREAAVAFLLRFLFSYDQVQGPIGKLSGGERSRLQLARLVLQRPNLLLLDEPTNNLDIAAIEVLEETLNEFVGTVLVISHDRFFLDTVVDRIVELRDGRLTEFVGGYTDYLAERGYDE